MPAGELSRIKRRKKKQSGRLLYAVTGLRPPGNSHRKLKASCVSPRALELLLCYRPAERSTFHRHGEDIGSRVHNLWKTVPIPPTRPISESGPPYREFPSSTLMIGSILRDKAHRSSTNRLRQFSARKGIGTVSRITSFLDSILRLPLVWGGLATLAYYAALNQGVIDSPLLVRYTASHPVEYCETTMFFVGLAALGMRILNLAGQFRLLKRATLGPIPAGGQGTGECDRLLGQLRSLPKRVQETYLARRLSDAIEFVRRKGSAEALDSHLRHLEELESIEVQSGYSTIRIIVWAIPILGLLGTVIGITMAVANLNPETLEQSMSKVTHGLGVAFDHTATALALTMFLMFCKSGVERAQDGLLARVDARTSDELVGRFQENPIGNDPNVAVIRRMSEQVIEAVETLAMRQADVWKSTIDATHEQWADVSFATSQMVRDTLSASLVESLERHAKVLSDGMDKHASHLSASAAEHGQWLERSANETTDRLRDGLEKLAELLVDALHRHGEVLTTSEKELARENRQHLSEVQAALGDSMVVAAERQEHLVRQSEHLLKEMQIALVEAAGATVRQQEELVRQSDILLRVVDATGQVTKLEDSLNQNLAALQQTYNFEETAVALTAAIQLFSARVGNTSASGRGAKITGEGPVHQAA
jgi:biopolymer transport protein ExbB/TolQ